MNAGELLVDTNTAKDENLHVGSRVPVTFAQTGPTTMRVGGIYKYNPLVGSYVDRRRVLPQRISITRCLMRYWSRPPRARKL